MHAFHCSCNHISNAPIIYYFLYVHNMYMCRGLSSDYCNIDICVNVQYILHIPICIKLNCLKGDKTEKLHAMHVKD